MSNKITTKIYCKPPITIDEQINQLIKKGLIVSTRQNARLFLKHVSYYRLRAYTYPFQDNATSTFHVFKRNDISLDDIIELYNFDNKLREILFSAISIIEVSLRTVMTQEYSEETNDSHWFTESSHYHQNYNNLIQSMHSEVCRSNEEFIKHYFTKYSIPSIPPSWMTLETVSLGTLSRLLKDLKESPIKKKIATQYGLPNSKILINWIHSISILRNHCAHHSRIWNRRFTVQIIVPRNTLFSFVSINHIQHIKQNKIYSIIIAISYLLDVIEPNNKFVESIKELIGNRNKLVNIKEMGFPADWLTEDLWKG